MDVWSLSGWGQALLSAFFPPTCLSCSALLDEVNQRTSACATRRVPRDLVCTACASQIDDCRIPECEWPGLTPQHREVRGCFYYRDSSPVRALHRAAKFEAHSQAAHYLGTELGLALKPSIGERSGSEADGGVVAVPVPSHPAKIRERSMNSTLEIALATSLVMGICCRPDLLGRQHVRASQSEVDGNERASNVRGVFVARPARARRILLIDDVLTTGSTLDEAANMLEEQGHAVEMAAVAFRREMFSRPRYR